MSQQYYILEGHKTIPVASMVWADWREKFEYYVRKDFVDNVEITTFFLGIAHRYDYTKNGFLPLLFETHVSGGKLDGWKKLYATWDESLAGHMKMLTEIEFYNELDRLLDERSEALNDRDAERIEICNAKVLDLIERYKSQAE